MFFRIESHVISSIMKRRMLTCWTDFIHSQMDSEAKGRDTGKDIWQTPYRVRKLETIPGGGHPGFTVVSAGPDKTFGTGDDISAVMVP
jgi:hypothetical protein